MEEKIITRESEKDAALALTKMVIRGLQLVMMEPQTRRFIYLP